MSHITLIRKEQNLTKTARSDPVAFINTTTIVVVVRADTGTARARVAYRAINSRNKKRV